MEKHLERLRDELRKEKDEKILERTRRLKTEKAIKDSYNNVEQVTPFPFQMAFFKKHFLFPLNTVSIWINKRKWTCGIVIDENGLELRENMWVS